jgi:hypothetical protein
LAKRFCGGERQGLGAYGFNAGLDLASTSFYNCPSKKSDGLVACPFPGGSDGAVAVMARSRSGLGAQHLQRLGGQTISGTQQKEKKNKHLPLSPGGQMPPGSLRWPGGSPLGTVGEEYGSSFLPRVGTQEGQGCLAFAQLRTRQGLARNC